VRGGAAGWEEVARAGGIAAEPYDPDRSAALTEAWEAGSTAEWSTDGAPLRFTFSSIRCFSTVPLARSHVAVIPVMERPFLT